MKAEEKKEEYRADQIKKKTLSDKQMVIAISIHTYSNYFRIYYLADFLDRTGNSS